MRLPFLALVAGGCLPGVHAHCAVFLSAFTTKTAVYVLARSFAGTECLLYIGAAMAMFPIFYAVIETICAACWATA